MDPATGLQSRYRAVTEPSGLLLGKIPDKVELYTQRVGDVGEAYMRSSAGPPFTGRVWPALTLTVAAWVS